MLGDVYYMGGGKSIHFLGKESVFALVLFLSRQLCSPLHNLSYSHMEANIYYRHCDDEHECISLCYPDTLPSLKGQSGHRLRNDQFHATHKPIWL